MKTIDDLVKEWIDDSDPDGTAWRRREDGAWWLIEAHPSYSFEKWLEKNNYKILVSTKTPKEPDRESLRKISETKDGLPRLGIAPQEPY